MKKLFIFLGAIFGLIILLFIAGTIYVFGFEKKVPLKYVDKYVDAVTEKSFIGDFSDINNSSDFKVKLTSSKYSYAVEGDKTNESLEEKTVVVQEKSGKDDSFVYEITTSIFDSNNKETTKLLAKYYRKDAKYMYSVAGIDTELTKDLWEANIKSFTDKLPVDESGKMEHVDLITDNLDKIIQKGLYLNVYAHEDNLDLVVKIKMTSKKAVLYKTTENTYTGDTLTSASITKCEISY